MNLEYKPESTSHVPAHINEAYRAQVTLVELTGALKIGVSLVVAYFIAGFGDLLDFPVWLSLLLAYTAAMYFAYRVHMSGLQEITRINRDSHATVDWAIKTKWIEPVEKHDDR